MPQAKPRPISENGPTPTRAAPKPDLREAGRDEAIDVHSPARALQSRLQEDLAALPGNGKRWSPRATLALAGGVSTLLWGAIAFAVSAIR